MNSKTWIKDFVQRFPAYEPQFHEAFLDEAGMILPHLFLGEITADILSSSRTFESSKQAILSSFEEGYERGDEALRNAIALSFVENLGWDSPLLHELGPQLSEVAKAIYPQAFGSDRT